MNAVSSSRFWPPPFGILNGALLQSAPSKTDHFCILNSEFFFPRMLSGISIVCFSASYALALALELSRLWFRMPVRFFLLLGCTAAGLLAQTLYLVHRAEAGEMPLSSWYDWFLIA